MDRTTLTANLKPLERRGLVTVSVDEKDRRNRLMTLTPAGRALLASAVPVWERTHVEIERLITSSDPDTPARRSAGAFLTRQFSKPRR